MYYTILVKIYATSFVEVLKFVFISKPQHKATSESTGKLS